MKDLLMLARADIRAGYPDSVAVRVAYVAALSLAFEAEALRWGAENGVEIVGHGFEARPVFGGAG